MAATPPSALQSEPIRMPATTAALPDAETSRAGQPVPAPQPTPASQTTAATALKPYATACQVPGPIGAGPLGIDPTLLDAVVASTLGALAMCDLTARGVGASRVPHQDAGRVTGMIGVHGSASGFVTVNMSERFAIDAVGNLMGDRPAGSLTAEVIDGAGELTNMIAGGVKSKLSASDWAFSQITVPSVIVGAGYCIAYARGLEFLSVTFERDDPAAVLLADRLMHVSISLLRS